MNSMVPAHSSKASVPEARAGARQAWQKYTPDLMTILNACKKIYAALAGVAQWTECGPANQRVTGSIPSQGICLGCRPGPQ